jgi:hypothetical protein
MTIHGVQSCSARTARLFARKLSAYVRGARPDRIEVQSAACAASPLARALSQRRRSTYELAVLLSAGTVVVRTPEENAVVVRVDLVAAVEVELVVDEVTPRVAGCSGAFVT